MRRPHLIVGALLAALGAFSIIEAGRLRDDWQGARLMFQEQAAKVNKVLAYKGPEAFWKFQEEELKKYLPLATKMEIRK